MKEININNMKEININNMKEINISVTENGLKFSKTFSIEPYDDELIETYDDLKREMDTYQTGLITESIDECNLLFDGVYCDLYFQGMTNDDYHPCKYVMIDGNRKNVFEGDKIVHNGTEVKYTYSYGCQTLIKK